MNVSPVSPTESAYCSSLAKNRGQSSIQLKSVGPGNMVDVNRADKLPLPFSYSSSGYVSLDHEQVVASMPSNSRLFDQCPILRSQNKQ